MLPGPMGEKNGRSEPRGSPAAGVTRARMRSGVGAAVVASRGATADADRDRSPSAGRRRSGRLTRLPDQRGHFDAGGPTHRRTWMDVVGLAGAAPAAIADYQVVRVLGEGNNGRFYLARPPARLGIPDEFVAVKVFTGQHSEQAYQRGVRELRAFAKVSSPVPREGLRRGAAGQLHVRHGVLPARLAGRPGPPAEPRRRCCGPWRTRPAALHALHEAGLTHGDLKPANVLRDRGRRQALRPRPGPVPHPRRHPDRHGERRVGRVPRPGAAAGRAAVPLHRGLRHRRHPAPGADRHGPLRRAARQRAAAGHPPGHERQARRSLRGLSPEEADLVRACLAPVGERPATALEVAERLEALAAPPLAAHA